eukprot:sb/3472305/
MSLDVVFICFSFRAVLRNFVSCSQIADAYPATGATRASNSFRAASLDIDLISTILLIAKMLRMLLILSCFWASRRLPFNPKVKQRADMAMKSLFKRKVTSLMLQVRRNSQSGMSSSTNADDISQNAVKPWGLVQTKSKSCAPKESRENKFQGFNCLKRDSRFKIQDSN